MKKRASVGRSLIEPLESRQLLSAVVDVRLPGGGKSVINPTVGQKIDVQVWVTITGSDNDITNEQLQIAVGSLLSSNVGGGVALGNMTSTVLSPFNADGAQNGTQTDLDGDGDLDVGSSDPSTADGYLYARSASMDGSGTAVTNGQAFEIATAEFTVTSLLSGTETDLVFRPRGSANGFLYLQDGQSSVNGGNLVAGTGVAITRTPSSTIAGRVFNDTNADGLFDGSDTGISGFRVFLDTNNNGILDAGEISKPVSATGTYTFTAVPPGTYRVREVFRDGWRQSFPALGYYQVTLGYNEAAKSQSFANTDTVLIKGTVFMDANKNKAFDPAESGMAGWTVFLDQNNNGILDAGETSTVTDASGNYRFFNMPAGHYLVRVVQQTAYKQTTPAGGVHSVTLSAAGTKSNQNFGEKRLK